MQPQRVSDFLRKYARIVLLVLILLSLVIDIGRFHTKSIDLKGGQTQSWWEIAHNVETGVGYKACNDYYIPNCASTEQFTAMREPLPVLLFALVGRISQDSELALTFMQILIYFLTFFGIFFLGKSIGSVDTGLLSLFFWTFYLPQENVEAVLTGDLLATTFLIFAFILFVQVVRNNRLGDWLAFGVVAGLAVLSRSASIVIALVLVGGYILYFHDKRWSLREIAWKGFLSLAILGMTISPWVIRNYIVFKEPVFGTSLVGYNLYRHNAIVATDSSPHYIGSEEAYAQVQELITRRPELKTPLNEIQVDKIYRQEAVNLIRGNPISYLKLVSYRVLPLWFNVGVPEQYGEQPSIYDYLAMLQQAFFLIALAIGLRLGKNTIHLFGLSIFIYCSSYLLVGSRLRYVIPIMPVVIIIGSFGILRLWSSNYQLKSTNTKYIFTPSRGM